MIKVLSISIDKTIKLFTSKSNLNSEYQFINFCSTTDPLEIMAQICCVNPSILILDDDFLSPHSIRLLESIKKVNPKLSIIFLTSNTSLPLGRQINAIGVKFYLMKPILENDFYEYLNSANKQLKTNKY